MNLKILKEKSVGLLKSKLEEDWKRYLDQADPLIDDSGWVESRVEVGDVPALEASVESDADNAAKVYAWLQQLSPVEAADERLWLAMTLDNFRCYTVQRWNPDSVKTVKSRFFYSGTGLETAVRNAVSRLWWFGYLTCDDESADPFELTRILLSNQDIQSAFTERSIGRYRPLLREVLRYIGANQEKIETLGTGKFVQAFAKEIRLRSGVVVVDVLSQGDLSALVNDAGRVVQIRMALSRG
ncbi:MAG: DUF6339 family protein [Verrucomicrobiales bacterium]|nr:DUF6339 family protein [Verrucomicrobiales bacterium]